MNRRRLLSLYWLRKANRFDRYLQRERDGHHASEKTRDRYSERRFRRFTLDQVLSVKQPASKYRSQSQGILSSGFNYSMIKHLMNSHG
jgi:hypothetical protein